MNGTVPTRPSAVTESDLSAWVKPVVAPEPVVGWRGALSLELSSASSRTILSHREHRGPFLVQRPFYPESDGTCHLYALHPPGGLVGGDRLELDMILLPGARSLFTTPSATKVYRSNGHETVSQQRISVGEGAHCEFFPLETIAFERSWARSCTTIDLARGASLMGWDIVCLGRPHSQQPLGTGRCRQRIHLRREGTPILWESTRYQGDAPAAQASWGLFGCTTFGTLYFVPRDSAELEAWREGDALSAIRGYPVVPGETTSVSVMRDACVARFAGHSGEAARRFFVHAWRSFRQALLGKDAVPPRVWST